MGFVFSSARFALHNYVKPSYKINLTLTGNMMKKGLLILLLIAIGIYYLLYDSEKYVFEKIADNVYLWTVVSGNQDNV
jgi:hypothetical protein